MPGVLPGGRLPGTDAAPASSSAGDPPMDPVNMRARILAVLGLLAFAAVPLAAAPPPAPASASAGATRCHNLTLHHRTSVAWARAFKRTRHLQGVRIRRDRPSYYGRCGTRFSGFGTFSPRRGQHLTERQQVAFQDGPDVFKRSRGHRWRDVSDTGGSVPCGGRFGLPRRPVALWDLTRGGAAPPPPTP